MLDQWRKAAELAEVQMKDEALALRGKNSELEADLGRLGEQLDQWRKMAEDALAFRGKNSELEADLGRVVEQLDQWRKAAPKKETKKESKNFLKRLLSKRSS